jgi:hypothetical protein
MTDPPATVPLPPSRSVRLWRRAFPGVGRSGWRHAGFRRHAGPDLLAAATCAVLLLPPLAATSTAQGMADAVGLQVLLAFFDLPIVLLVALLAPPRWPLAVSAGAIVLVYAVEGGWLCHLALRTRAFDFGFVALFLLPIALRATSLIGALREGERAATMALLSLGLVLPWMLSFVLVALPLASWAGLETVDPASGASRLHAAAWLAMGVLHFTLAALLRAFVGLRVAPVASRPLHEA